MVSQLVCGKTGEIAERFSKLLENEREFERVKDALDDGAELNAAITLFVQLVLLGSGGWSWRFTLRILEPPFLFLAIVEKPVEEECEMRKKIASRLCQLRPCCMHRLDGAHSCITHKLFTIFADSWQRMRYPGRMTSSCLWAFLLTLRSAISGETQGLEGWNSILQVMAKRAPRMELALASDRLSIKKGAWTSS